MGDGPSQNKIMLQGKKPAAEKIVYEAFNMVSEKTKDDPLKIFKESLENIKPLLEVRSRRVGGATYQVPMEVRPDRKVSLGLRWLVLHARERGEKSMEEKLANEILDALQKRGGSILRLNRNPITSSGEESLRLKARLH